MQEGVSEREAVGNYLAHEISKSDDHVNNRNSSDQKLHSAQVSMAVKNKKKLFLSPEAFILKDFRK